MCTDTVLANVGGDSKPTGREKRCLSLVGLVTLLPNFIPSFGVALALALTRPALKE
jgi:hypothetical protein